MKFNITSNPPIQFPAVLQICAYACIMGVAYSSSSKKPEDLSQRVKVGEATFQRNAESALQEELVILREGSDGVY